jgi:hypothetical protein
MDLAAVLRSVFQSSTPNSCQMQFSASQPIQRTFLQLIQQLFLQLIDAHLIKGVFEFEEFEEFVQDQLVTTYGGQELEVIAGDGKVCFKDVDGGVCATVNGNQFFNTRSCNGIVHNTDEPIFADDLFAGGKAPRITTDFGYGYGFAEGYGF